MLAAFLAISLLILAGCQPSSGNGANSTETPAATPNPYNTEGYQEQADVEEIQINLMESFPIQVSVNIMGNLPDGCTSIVEIKPVKVDDQTFQIYIFTQKTEDAVCAQSLVPFEGNIGLDVFGLPAGTYTVKAYDIENTFTFDVENK
jgi:inhibitor of cysteine peptidase